MYLLVREIREIRSGEYWVYTSDKCEKMLLYNMMYINRLSEGF